MTLLGRESPAYADLVFHVLSHVRRSADVPASLYDAEWIRRAATALGPARDRTLAEDAEALGLLVQGHEALARVQLLAWLFGSVERAAAVAARELEELTPGEVDAPELLAPLRQVGPAAELLRLAAELERPFHARLPAPELDLERVEQSLSAMLEVAPELARCTVELLPALRLRGRVRGARVWVGVPDRTLGPSIEHVSWQAAHEATVREVGLRAALAERRVEQLAVVLLAERAERAGRSGEHARWLEHFGPNAPETSRRALDAGEQQLLRALLG